VTIHISAIIPVYKRQTAIRTLASLEDQHFEPDGMEAIVVFDAEDENFKKEILTRQWKFPVKILSQKTPRGAGAARNLGAKQAQGQLLVFFDDDIAASPGLLQRHWDAHQKSAGKSLAFGKVVTDPSSPESFLRFWMDDWKHQYFERCERGTDLAPYYFCSANFSVPRSLFLEQTGFDEEYRSCGWEEADLGIRLKAAGFQFIYLPDAVGSELYVKQPIQASGHMAFEQGQNQVRLIRKHPGYRKHTSLVEAFHGGLKSRLLIRLGWNAPTILKLLLLIAVPQTRRFRIRYVLQFWQGVKKSGMSWKELRDLFAAEIVVLAYHDVPEHPDTHNSFDVAKTLFAKQMNTLKTRGYHAVSLNEFLSWLHEGNPLPRNAVLLTFDDGYKSFASFVIPILTRHNFSSVLFISPAHVGSENHWDQKFNLPAKFLMTWEEIESLGDSVAIGAHGMFHTDLAEQSAASSEKEIAASRESLEQRAHIPSAFAYPFGASNPEIAEMVRKAGFQCAFTVEEGKNHIGVNPFLFKRAVVTRGDRGLFFRYKLRFGKSLFPKLRYNVRKLFPRNTKLEQTANSYPS
jgi:peptidoglycan/xylan/chitin deacetylase (PgdA/CDA1 family)/GT2 family glycosyltransferase